MSMVSDVWRYWRFTFGLREYLRNPLTLEQSKVIIKSRLERRVDTFLSILKKGVYENDKSPYLKLLKLAGCEYEDIEAKVRADGIEASLKKLSEEGVWLSLEQFEGREEVTRGGKVFKFKETDFDNPFFFRGLKDREPRARTRTMFDLDFWAQEAVCFPPILDANDALGLPLAMWRPSVSLGGESFVLMFTKAGSPPVKWYSQVDEKAIRPSLKNRMLTDYLIYLGRIYGTRWPSPEHVQLDDAGEIAWWMAKVLEDGKGCCMMTTPSNACRIARAAKETGLALDGAKFLVEGEALTQTKLKEIQSAGATTLSIYWFTEGGLVGGSCSDSCTRGGGVHVMKDSIAVIQHKRKVEHAGAWVDAFLFSSLLPAAPRILLNVESEDHGLIESRYCGCKLEALGLTDHIYNIRGFGWFRAEGTRVFTTDLQRIIENLLPAKFGGSPTDYQMLEEEDEQGFTRVNVVVSPAVGPVNEGVLISVVLDALRTGLGYQRKETYRETAEFWSQAGTLRVVRMAPTGAGEKLIPLHIRKEK